MKQSQLQRQMEEVAEIERQLAEERNPAPSEPVEPSEPAAPVTPEPPATPPAEPQTPIVSTEDDAAKWKARYQAIEGKYRVEVPRLNSRVKELEAQVASLTAALNTAPTTTGAKQVTEKDTELFGADLLEAVKRQALDALGGDIATLKAQVATLAQENAALRGQVTGVVETQETVKQDTILSRLTKEVPDWEAINVDPLFLAWLAEADPMSGLRRQDYLENALTSGDAARLATIFKAWKSTKTEAPEPPKPKPNTQVQEQITPGKTRSSTAPVANPFEGKVWSMVEIEQFYNDVRANRFDGKREDMVKMEAEIDRAIAEGRVK